MPKRSDQTKLTGGRVITPAKGKTHDSLFKKLNTKLQNLMNRVRQQKFFTVTKGDVQAILTSLDFQRLRPRAQQGLRDTAKILLEKVDEKFMDLVINEEVIPEAGLHFSRARVKQQRYIPFVYHDQLEALLKKGGFFSYSVRNPLSYEKWFITKFDDKKRRYHLVVKYKYRVVFETKILYFFWVNLHQDEETDHGRHKAIHTKIKCPFCDYIVKGKKLHNDFPIHFKKEHIQIPTQELYGMPFDLNSRVLSLGKESIDEIKGFEKFTKLELLYLRGSRITETKGLETLTNLDTLNLANNMLTDIKGVENLTNLVSLDLSDNQITSLQGLEHLKNLYSLRVTGNPLKDVAALKELASLKNLVIDVEDMLENQGQLLTILQTQFPSLYKNHLMYLTDKHYKATYPDDLEMQHEELPHRWYDIKVRIEKQLNAILEEYQKN